MAVDFDHRLSAPSLEGVRAALPILLSRLRPQSILDVGCGLGAWVRAALDTGIDDVIGLDGGLIDEHQLLIPARNFRPLSLNQPFNLGRKFDLVLCLEVAEHLPAADAQGLVSSLVSHADTIYFSAACPGQVGQGHVNCQWPSYWQKLFNAEGYVCDDAIRWQLWETRALNFYYRQNMFLAERSPANAGREPRILPVVHPEMLKDKNGFATATFRADWLKQVEEGSQPTNWYLSTPAKAFSRKIFRRLFANRRLPGRAPQRSKVEMRHHS